MTTDGPALAPHRGGVVFQQRTPRPVHGRGVPTSPITSRGRLTNAEQYRGHDVTRPQSSQTHARQSIAADYRFAREQGMSPMQAALHIKQVCAIVLADTLLHDGDPARSLMHYRIARRYVEQAIGLAHRRAARRAVTA